MSFAKEEFFKAKSCRQLHFLSHKSLSKDETKSSTLLETA
jgi:hypothetical protein